MKCIKCGMDLPAGGSYCPGCGTMNEREVTTSPVKPKIKPIVAVIAALAGVGLVAVIVAVVLARGSGNVTSAPGGTPPPSGNITTAPPGQPSSGNITTAPPGSPAPPSVTPSSTPKPKPPQAVVDYLEHVKKAEEHRQVLLKDTTEALTMAAVGGAGQSLMDMIDMASDSESSAKARDPLQDTKDELNRQYKNWLAELEFFDKKAAPPECREFSGAYRSVIYNEAKAIGEIAVSFNNVNIMDPKDMSKLLDSLQKIKKDPSIQANIDQSADTANSKLDGIVSNYDMVKPFNVPREQSGGGSITGF
ncbi:MAG: hypothetical protein NT018_12950 [Armatimonadetes bacterium]|nr:hypothetical protein [Armatimonadota bacterium]